MWPALPFPGLDDEIGHALKVGEVIRDQYTLGVQCRCGNEQIRIGEQGALSMEVAVQRSGALHHLVGERENEAGLTQKRKCRLLGPRLFGLQPRAAVRSG